MSNHKLRFVFLVQGEGRGHMTQAISLFRMLTKAGHEVVQVFIGKSEHRQIPRFVYEQINAPIEELPSPNFVFDKQSKGINITQTIVKNLAYSPQYLKSLKRMRNRITKLKPDRIVNFYDFLGGIYAMRYRVKIPFICIGHQYLAHHPDFPFVPGKTVAKKLFLLNNWITSYRSKKLLALSFQKYSAINNPKLSVVPPLLREDVLKLVPEDGDYFLIYILNKGYAEELKTWHQANPQVTIHCFWDNHEAPETLTIDENLHFHRLNDVAFMQKMGGCMAYFSTAGFESICEAMYLGKPVMMVPVEGHYEQQCNALDAQKAGAGISDSKFELSKMLDYLPKHQSISAKFRKWADGAEKTFLQLLTQ